MVSGDMGSECKRKEMAWNVSNSRNGGWGLWWRGGWVCQKKGIKRWHKKWKGSIHQNDGGRWLIFFFDYWLFSLEKYDKLNIIIDKKNYVILYFIISSWRLSFSKKKRRSLRCWRRSENVYFIYQILICIKYCVFF